MDRRLGSVMPGKTGLAPGSLGPFINRAPAEWAKTRPCGIRTEVRLPISTGHKSRRDIFTNFRIQGGAMSAIDRLKSQLRGDLITPESSGYHSARRIWNGMIDKRPAVIVGCAGVADVVAT